MFLRPLGFLRISSRLAAPTIMGLDARLPSRSLLKLYWIVGMLPEAAGGFFMARIAQGVVVLEPKAPDEALSSCFEEASTEPSYLECFRWLVSF